MEKAVLAAGCFWGVQELIRTMPGVSKTQVGYTGGHTENPTYEMVKTGQSGHAEAIEIHFDPSVLSFAELLRFFFTLHDPTTLNQQGNDIGSQYRSSIFAQNAEQKRIAKEIIEETQNNGMWAKPIVTHIEDAATFYSAEGYHQDYLQKNPGGYTCHFIRQV